jgi:cytochrome c oxidase assembly protein subunit 15
LASIETPHLGDIAPARDRLRPVRIWLYCIAALVLLMVALGGITRLTDSGLSIVEWKPISGALPPLSDADWQAEFDAYQQIPEYQMQNRGMSLDAFKYIFWWEWSHRFLGRVIGFAFAVPFLVFLVQRRFSWSLAAPLAGLFVLGGLQGALGWWMVSSGLSERVDVSQYRLAAHLGAAALLFMALVWVARRLEPRPMTPERPRWPIVLLLLLVFVQLIAGAFVAGIDAGMGYNTWPLMDGALIPSGLGIMQPWWLNLFENALTVQFVHRCIAYVIVLYTGLLLWRQARRGGFVGVNGWLPRIGVLIALQVVLGIATLLSAVPISLALGHQALAFLLCGTIVAYLADMTGKTAR